MIFRCNFIDCVENRQIVFFLNLFFDLCNVNKIEKYFLPQTKKSMKPFGSIEARIPLPPHLPRDFCHTYFYRWESGTCNEIIQDEADTASTDTKYCTDCSITTQSDGTFRYSLTVKNISHYER